MLNAELRLRFINAEYKKGNLKIGKNYVDENAKKEKF